MTAAETEPQEVEEAARVVSMQDFVHKRGSTEVNGVKELLNLLLCQKQRPSAIIPSLLFSF